ncbi:MAG: sensor histidine kinase [Bacteroidia bacterium]
MENSNELTFADELLVSELKKRLEEKNKLLQTQASLLVEMSDMNRKLRKAEQVKSGFLSNIRNEINNPMASIIGLSEQLTGNTPVEGDRLKRAAAFINSEVTTLDFQLRNIFAAAEIEAGEVNPKAAQVDVKKLIGSQIDYFRKKAEHNNITINYEHFSSQQLFKTDAYLLQVIIMNILSNAVTFSNKGGEVAILSRIADRQLEVSIQDFGIGIEEVNLPLLFERFRQVETGTTKKHMGHGLGLSVVKDFIDALKGDIEIQSRRKETTVVVITLPELENEELIEGLASGNDILFTDAEVF